MSNIFLLRRLHSLSGIVPIGAFLIEHLYTNFKVINGPEAFNEAVKSLRDLLPGPLLLIAEVFFIGLPILFHAALGVYIAYTMRNNVNNYFYARNWMYFFQRVAGIFLVLFIGLHVASLRFGFWGIGNHLSVDEHVYDPVNTPFVIVQNDLSQPIILAFYFLGIGAAAYHFGYGLWSFAIHWGITVSERSQKAWQMVCASVSLGILMLGVTAAIKFI